MELSKDVLDWYDNDTKQKKQALLDKIEKTKSRLSAKDKAIEELKYERDLIFGNLCSIISNDLRNSYFNIFYGFNDNMFWKAWRWSCHKDTVDKELKEGKLTKEEYKETKTCFDMTTSVIKDKFFGDLKDQVKFKEIIMSWTTGYDYTYIYKDQEITIFIPLFHADEKDWEYALIGYRANYKESEYCQGYICSSLEYEEVATKLQEWLLKEGWKKNDAEGKTKQIF